MRAAVVEQSVLELRPPGECQHDEIAVVLD
jgi:hypothetical protein